MTDRTPGVRSSQIKGALDLIATVTFVVACLSLTWTLLAGAVPTPEARAKPRARWAELPPPSTPVSLKGKVPRGSTAAKVVLLEFADFQCPFCARFAQETLPTLDKKYIRSGKVQMVFYHLPLPNHQLAQKAAEATECAASHDKFWAMHDGLFQSPTKLALPDLIASAKSLGIPDAPFETCLSGRTTGQVVAEAALAKSLGVVSTPTFFVGTIDSDGDARVAVRLSGAQPSTAFETAIDRLLSVRDTRSALDSRQ